MFKAKRSRRCRIVQRSAGGFPPSQLQNGHPHFQRTPEERNAICFRQLDCQLGHRKQIRRQKSSLIVSVAFDSKPER